MLEFYQHLPEYIDPIAFSIGSFSARWYAISYLIGFAIVYGLLRLRISRDELPKVSNYNSSVIKNSKLDIQNTIIDLILVGFFSALIGGRIGYVLFYNSAYFFANPMEIISPYRDGIFVGLYGMSYHGALIGVLLGEFLFARVKKIDFLAWADFILPAISLGYFFGRIGNFLNGELYGRVTESSFGMYFNTGLKELRHPSQLYEAATEGFFLFLILWSMRNREMRKGAFVAIYLFGYGFMRMISELFRKPDDQIGFLFGYFTLGQVFSLLMMFIGVIIFYLLPKKVKQ